ncbi:MAG: hypothetical protein ACRDQ6_23010 [Pseudonocardiaceae bacterium]
MPESVPVQPCVRVRGIRPGTSADRILALLQALPKGAEGEYDDDVGALIVRVYGGMALMSAVLRLFCDSGIVLGNPGSEEAILKYLPDRTNEPADWDVLDADWAICAACNGWSTPPVSGRAELEAEMRRHTNRMHRGRGHYE